MAGLSHRKNHVPLRWVMRPTFDQPVVLVLASGRGERFKAAGGSGSKLDALLGGKPVLQRTLDAVRASGLPWHVERQGHAGMGDSIAAAVRSTSEAPGWLVLPGDLPMVSAETLRAVAAALAGHSLVLPYYQGQRGHPVGFGSACRNDLLELTGAQGAASVVKKQGELSAPFKLELNDPGMVMDIDTPADLARAEAMLSRGA